jgi:hypothetical protein
MEGSREGEEGEFVEREKGGGEGKEYLQKMKKRGLLDQWPVTNGRRIGGRHLQREREKTRDGGGGGGG